MAHDWPTTSPIPQEEEVSSQMSGSRQGRGMSERETANEDSNEHHQVRSVWTGLGR